MIKKHDKYKNGYYFMKDTQDGFLFNKTALDLRTILDAYGDTFKRVICNAAKAKNFKVTGVGKSPITVNNTLNDGCFFVNTLD